MATVPNIGSPFARVAPIFISPGDGVLKETYTKHKELKLGMRPIFAAIQALSSIKASDEINESLTRLQNSCGHILGLVNVLAKPEHKKTVLLQVDGLTKVLNFETTITALEKIKTDLLALSGSKTAITEDDVHEIFIAFEDIKHRVGGAISQIETTYPKVLIESERLRHKIDSYAAVPIPAGDAIEQMIFRCDGKINGELVRRYLTHAESKEQERAERYNKLTLQWNQLAVQTTEITAYINAIDAVKPVMFNLINSKQKFEAINKTIKEMLQAYENYESKILAHEFDPISHAPKSTTFEDLNGLDFTYSSKFKDLQSARGNKSKLSTSVAILKTEIQKTLETLRSSPSKTSPVEENNKLYKHQAEVANLFVETNKKNINLFKQVEKEIDSNWGQLKTNLKEAHLFLKFIECASKFTSEIATLYIQNQEFAKKLRDARKELTSCAEYQAVHSKIASDWDTSNAGVPQLKSDFEKITADYNEFMRVASALLNHKNDKPQSEYYLKNEAFKGFQRFFKAKYDNLSLYWNTNLPTISRCVAKELNRGNKALEVDGYTTNFKDAFGTETAFLITDKASALVPNFIKSWTTTTDAETPVDPEIYYQSPFDKV